VTGQTGARLRVLRAEPGFVPFVAGQWISAFGDAVVPVALALAVLEVSGSPLMFGLVLASSLLARVASLLVGGVYADQAPRWRIMAIADTVRTAVQLLAGVLLVTDRATTLLLLVLGVLYGLATGMFAPASSGLLPELVRSELLQQANAVLGVGRNTARIVGPLAAALIVATAGTGWAFLLDAATFAVDGLLLLMIGKRLGVARRQPVPLWPAFVDGLRELRGRRWYVANLGVHSLWNVAMAGFYVLGPAVVLTVSGPASWGVVMAAFAAGSVAGGLLAVAVTPRRPPVVVNVLVAVAALPLISLGLSSPVAVIAVTAVIAAAASTFVNDVWTALAQSHLPRASLSRLMSFDWLVSQALSPVGYLLVGIGAERYGYGATLMTAALVVAVPATSLAALSASGRLVPPAAAPDAPAEPTTLAAPAGSATPATAAPAVPTAPPAPASGPASKAAP
jgi:MFS family permease